MGHTLSVELRALSSCQNLEEKDQVAPRPRKVTTGQGRNCHAIQVCIEGDLPLPEPYLLPGPLTLRERIERPAHLDGPGCLSF